MCEKVWWLMHFRVVVLLLRLRSHGMDKFLTSWKIWPNTIISLCSHGTDKPGWIFPFDSYLLTEVFPPAHAQRASLTNSKWRLPAELPRIHATVPLPYKNLHGHGVHIALVKFSTVPLKDSASILALKFSYGQRGTPAKRTKFRLVWNSSGT